MHQDHQAGVAQFAGHGQTLGRSEAGFLAEALKDDLAVDATGVTPGLPKSVIKERFQWLPPLPAPAFP